jgi:homocysteine S-methyltransferase
VNPIKPFLEKQSVCIIDGGFGSELSRRGYDLSDPLWSAILLMKNPDAISKVHFDYLQAGADIIITASYQASIEGFLAHGLSENEAIELIKYSINLAKQTRDDFWQNCSDTNRLKPLVAASVGPYGAFLADGSEYRGDYGVNFETLANFHKKRLAHLIDAKPDILAIETIPSLEEARAIVEVLKEFPNIKAWLSFSAKDEEHICHNEPISQCAKWLDKEDQIVAIGVNCTAPQYVSSLTKIIKSNSSKPIVLYPNGGGIYDPVTKKWQTPPMFDYVMLAKEWQKAGAQLIGGCCKTTPEDIAKLSAWVRG